MAEVSQFLYQLGELSGETIFIDGTKIEACANKYTFVWKKAVSKNLGKRLEKLAAFVELCEETYGIKVVCQNQMKMKHVKKLHICGTRNSYSKTDHDATFMRMKEDAMGNGQLKAGYNLQHGVDSEYISWLTLGSQPADTYTCHNWKKSHKESIKKRKPGLDMNGRQQFISARNAVDVHIRRNASRGTTVRPPWRIGTRTCMS